MSKIRMKWVGSSPRQQSTWPWPRGKYQMSPGSKSFVSAQPCGIDDGGSHAARDDERPFGGGGVPVKLAHDARLEDHRDAGDALGDRQLLDRGFAADAAADDFAGGFFELEFESGKFFAAEEGVGDVVIVHGKARKPAGFQKYSRLASSMRANA